MTHSDPAIETVDLGYRPNLDDARAFDGVLTRRVMAFVVDYILIGILIIPVAIVVGILGVLTLGLGWMLYPVLGFAVALIYVAMTLGSAKQSTPGMRIFGIRLVRVDGGPIGPMTAMMHTVLFWVGNAVLTPLILLATLFLDGKRTLHDLLLATVVIRD
ncbi:MAG: RDD family protein [Mesorhizobium sp.]